MGASVIYTVTCERCVPLAEGGTALGHEILLPDMGCSFNSLESLHLDERALFQKTGVAQNERGLIDSFEEALASCRLVEHTIPRQRASGSEWLPWLIVRYAL